MGPVGVLVALQLDDVVYDIEGYGDDRRAWLCLPLGHGRVVMCAVHGPPGGDVTFWTNLTEEHKSLRGEWPDAKFILAGDADIHLSYLHPCGHPS